MEDSVVVGNQCCEERSDGLCGDEPDHRVDDRAEGEVYDDLELNSRMTKFVPKRVATTNVVARGEGYQIVGASDPGWQTE